MSGWTTSTVMPFLVSSFLMFSFIFSSSSRLFSSIGEKANVLNWLKLTVSFVTVVLNGQVKSTSLVVSRLYIEKAEASWSSDIDKLFLQSFLINIWRESWARFLTVMTTSDCPAGFSNCSISPSEMVLTSIPLIVSMMSNFFSPASSADE